MKGNHVDFGKFVSDLMKLTDLNHTVARSTRNVIATALKDIAAGLDTEVHSDSKHMFAALHGLESRVFTACQYPENRTEAAYVVTLGGNVIRVRVDAFEVENALDAISGDPDTDDVRAYVAGMIAELNTRVNG